MALQMSIQRRNVDNDDDDDDNNLHEFDEEIEETEDDLLENYRFLTQKCGALRQSPTISGINSTPPQQQQTNQLSYLRQCSSVSDKPNNTTTEYQRSYPSTKQWCSPSNDLNNNNQNYSTAISRIPPTIYYNDTDDNELASNRSFSLIKLFARMKARLKHDKRYRPRPTHELLYEEDPQEWYELTKNVRTILTKALLPDGGYDALTNRLKTTHSRHGSYKKSREQDPVLANAIDDDDDKIEVNIDEELNTEGDEEYDEIIWSKFLTCQRGFKYRRCGVCKTVDRQEFQGQLVYFYGVANNILIDENLKASGLG
jgi:hypothetical protein